MAAPEDLRHAPSDQRAPAAHRFLAYTSTDEMLEVVVPYLEEGAALGDALFVNLPVSRVVTLRERLGSDSEKIAFTDTYAWMPHPTRRLRAIEELITAETGDGRRVRFVGECAWPSGPPALLGEWERFDAMLNDTLTGRDAEMLCLYDASALPADVVDRAARCHPLHAGLPGRTNPDYLPPEIALRTLLGGPLEAPKVLPLFEGAPSPREARSALAAELARRGIAELPVDDAAMVVTELVANSAAADARRIELRLWEWEEGVVVQVDDDGEGVKDPRVGYRMPPASAQGGRGLWITRQLAAATEIAVRPDGTSVRVHLRATRGTRPVGA